MPTTTIATTFAITIRLFTPADTRVPASRSTVHRTTSTTAGALQIAPVATRPAVVTSTGACVKIGGTLMPRSALNDTAYPDHPIAPNAAANRYSSTRHQPISHATTSPKVA